MQSTMLRQAMIWLALLIVGSCQLPVTNAQTSDPAPAHKVKLPKRIQISVSTADPQNGIAGFVLNEKTGVRINFQSKRIGEGVTAQITDKDDRTLIEYI